MKDLSSFEERINSHVFLTLEREREPSAYEREKNRFLELVWEYVSAIRSDASELALEIVETVDACLKFYDSAGGSFTHYFNSALKRAAAKSAAKEARLARSGGMHVPDGLTRDATALLRFSKSRGIAFDEMSKKADAIASVLGMTRERIGEALDYIYYEKTLSVDSPEGDEDDSDGWLDRISSLSVQSGGPESEYIEKERSLAINCAVSELYGKADGRAKRVISMKLTDSFARSGETVPDLPFIDKKLYTLIKKSGKGLKDRDIAAACGCSAPNVTQIWRRFTAALREKLKEL